MVNNNRWAIRVFLVVIFYLMLSARTRTLGYTTRYTSINGWICVDICQTQCSEHAFGYFTITVYYIHQTTGKYSFKNTLFVRISIALGMYCVSGIAERIDLSVNFKR